MKKLPELWEIEDNRSISEISRVEKERVMKTIAEKQEDMWTELNVHGPCTMKMLALHLNISFKTASKRLVGLEVQGLARRQNPKAAPNGRLTVWEVT